MRRRLIQAIVLSVVLGIAVPAQADPGDPDSGFGICGAVERDLGYIDEFAFDMEIQPDGKIVTAGHVYLGGADSRILITRWLPNGSLDPSFASQGILTDAPTSEGANANNLALQSDGRILVAGGTGNSGVVARYNSDGTSDLGFGNQGYVVSSTYGVSLIDLLVQPNGEIVVVGDLAYVGASLARLQPNGELDSAFGSRGYATSSVTPQAVIRQPDGKLLLAGWVTTAGSNDFDFALERFNENGTVDQNFGSSGVVTHDFGGMTNDQPYDLVVRSDGSVVLTGTSDDDLALVAFTTQGTLDTSFGANGVVVADFGGGEFVYSLALQSDGKILVGGRSFQPPTPGFPGSGYTNYALLTRFGSSGTIDGSFGMNGVLLVDKGGTGEQFVSVALDPSGGVIASGFLNVARVWPYTEPTWDLLLMRFQNATSAKLSGYVLDGRGGLHSFAAEGGIPPPCTNSAPSFGNTDIARAVAILPDGTGGFLADGYGGVHPFGVDFHLRPGTYDGIGYFSPYFNFDIAREFVLLSDATGGYLLDGYGGVHPYSITGAPIVSATGVPYFGVDIARDIVLHGPGGYLLDGYGGVHPFGLGGSMSPPTATGLPYFEGLDIARALVMHPGGGGYVLDGLGRVHPFGGAPTVTGTPSLGFDIARDIVLLDDGTGGYLLDGFGIVYPFSTAGNPMPPPATGTPYFGFDIARRLAVVP